MRRTRLNISSLLVVASLLVFLAAQHAEAQSGRRAPKVASPSAPATPASQSQPEPSPAAPAKQPTQPQISLLLLNNISQDIYLAIPSPERVQRWVAKRLRDASALAVMEGESVSRKDAINRAKAAKEGFIIFLEFDRIGLNTTIPGSARPNYEDMRINYSVFSPVTGKAKTSGVVYLNQSTNISVIGIGRGRGIPSCYPGGNRDDYILIQASLEVANRIINALNVIAQPICS
ncbi:MAG: hypothetical protein ICV60_00035 [Pyrinomonadaceae bacterium]|nr:hypothetical protein [Pyrinomonadaceae bacterium]